MFPCIRSVVEAIVGICHPQQIYLYNQKNGVDGAPRSFKLCVITDAEDAAETEKQLYLAIDCELPFDLLLYSAAEWARCSSEPHSFAHRILETGRPLLG